MTPLVDGAEGRVGRDVRPIDAEVLIIGAGFSGMSLAMKLKRGNFQDFLVLERGDDVGGVWRDNKWPGLAVDAPIHAYTYEFELSPSFSRLFPTQPEILEYARFCARKYEIRPHIRFCVIARKAIYDDERNVWRVFTTDGKEFVARFLVSATNAFGDPRLPDISGLKDFGGDLIHPARWPKDFAYKNKTLAVIGTGATAVQVVPTLAPDVRQLYVFQRTPIWCLPKGDVVYSMHDRERLRRFPWILKARRHLGFLRSNKLWNGVVNFKKRPEILKSVESQLDSLLKAVVIDPETRRKLRPSYGFMCKRPAITDDYWPAFNRTNVELITDPIRNVMETGIVTAGGRTMDVDAIVTATGYEQYGQYTPVTFDVIGRGNVNLGQYWLANGFQAYEGVAMPGFPNFFMFCGPTSLGGYTYFNMIRNSRRFILRALRHAWNRNANYIEVTKEAHARDRAYLAEMEKGCAYLNNRCEASNSYYVDRHGHVTFHRMSPELRNVWRSLTSSMRDYVFERKGLPEHVRSPSDCIAAST